MKKHNGLTVRYSHFICIFGAIALSFLPSGAWAQSLNLDLGDGGSATSKIVQILGLLTVLSLAPSILIMVTSFARIIIVLSLLRSAIGIQQTPPNPVLVSLALFLTFFIMAPTMEASYKNGIQPLLEEKITESEALEKSALPFHKFMLANTREKDINLFTEIARIKTEKAEDTPYRVLIPAFMISELRRAFEIGFLIYIPFLIIDMLVASILMAMGMMMLPPVTISLPFKLVFFVLADGWYMICGSMVKSFQIPF